MSEIEEKEPMKLLPYVPKDGTSEKEKCLQKMRHDGLECLMKMTGMETLIEND